MQALSLKIDRVQDTVDVRGDSRSSLYNDVMKGLWTRPIKITRKSSGWPAHENQALIAARIAEKSPDDIRALVHELHAQRKLLPQLATSEGCRDPRVAT